MEDFYKIVSMLRVIGVVDGLLIFIRVLYNDEYNYVCYKGFYVVNVMVVCNVYFSFINFVCRWQGFIYDLVVFNGSMFYVYFEDGGG